MTDFSTKYVNLASPKLGTQVVFATDEFFAAKERMIQDSEPVFIDDKFDDHGKWMDGWESRRRRDGGNDWCLIKLGAKGIVKGVDIDTRHFTGNYPPAASVQACMSNVEPGEDAQWIDMVPPTTLGPSAQHLIEVDCDQPVNWLRLNMYPDGGIARFRAYGEPYCEWKRHDPNAIHELSLLVNGARILGYNDAHYGNLWSLLTEGRGENMGDGWETRRRREPGNDWIVIALGKEGIVNSLEVDTAFFKGNFPDMCSVHGARVDAGTDQSIVTQSMFWPELLPKQKLSADNIHNFDASMITDIGPVTHVRLNIYPDGGVSRFRVFGKLT